MPRDFEKSARSLMHGPGSAMIFAALGTGFGASAAIVVLLVAHPQPPLVRHDDVIRVARPRIANLSLAEYAPVRAMESGGSELDACCENSGPFVGVAAYSATPLRIGHGQSASDVQVALVSGDYFSVLGSPIHLGRPIGREHAVPGPLTRVVVISYEYWQDEFEEDQEALGRQIIVAGVPLTVIGVARPGLADTAPGSAALWIPLALISDLADQRQSSKAPSIS